MHLLQGSGTLFVVPTPVGNLGDMTLALRRSRSASVWRRHPHHGQIAQALWGRHLEVLPSAQRTSRARRGHWTTARGVTMALCSDAGTPGISNLRFSSCPRLCGRRVKVECLPGTAFVPALVASGLPCDRFTLRDLPQEGPSRNGFGLVGCRAPWCL